MAADRGFKKLIDMGVYANDFGFTAVIGRTAWLNDNASTARAFMRATAAACDFFYDPKNRTASIDSLVGLAKVDPAIAGKVYDYYTMRLHPYAKHMDLPDAYVRGVAEYLVQSGAVPGIGAPGKYVDHRYLA
jgi:ABC-type nitrate/sulfonate/bicarbonate transport system substrate-binding protein